MKKPRNISKKTPLLKLKSLELREMHTLLKKVKGHGLINIYDLERLVKKFPYKHKFNKHKIKF